MESILFSEYIWKLQQWITDNFRIFNETEYFKEKQIYWHSTRLDPHSGIKKTIGPYKKKEWVGECSARINDNLSFKTLGYQKY